MAKKYGDNKATINISLSSVTHGRTKHIKIYSHFIKEKVENETICMTYAPAKKNKYIFTKWLPPQNFIEFIGKLVMINTYYPTWKRVKIPH